MYHNIIKIKDRYFLELCENVEDLYGGESTRIGVPYLRCFSSILFLYEMFRSWYGVCMASLSMGCIVGWYGRYSILTKASLKIINRALEPSEKNIACFYVE